MSLTDIPDEILSPLARVHKVLCVIIMGVGTLRPLEEYIRVFVCCLYIFIQDASNLL